MNNNKNMLIFVDGANTAYMNSADNFRGVNHDTDDKLDVYFKAASVGGDGASAGYDKITLSVTDEKELDAMKGIAGAVAGAKTPYTVVAYDVNSTYSHQNITAVDSITLSATGRFPPIISWTADTNLEAYNSGAWVVAADATALDLNLPTASGNAGVFYEIFIQKAQTGDTHIMAESGDYFEGGLFIADADTATENIEFHLANTAEDDVINLDSDAKGRLAGGYIKLVCDGTKWHVTGQLNGTGSIATPFHTAES